LFTYFGKWLRLAPPQRMMFREAYIYMGIDRFQVLTRPFKKIAKQLGTTGKPEIEPATDPVVIRQVAEPSL
jgi:hypothetical protein